VEVLVEFEGGFRGTKHDLAGAVPAEVVECGGEERGEVEVESELDDEDWVGAEFSGKVVAFSICGGVLAKVPAGKGGGPIELEALEAELAEVVNEVFCGKAENTGDGWEIVCMGIGEVPW
jgi:hypothetical protein